MDYNDGSSFVCDGTYDLFISDNEPLRPDQETIEVWIADTPSVIALLEITVNSSPVIDVYVLQEPDKTTYVVGDEVLLTGLVIQLEKENGYLVPVPYDDSLELVVTFFFNEAATTEITITFLGFEMIVPITVESAE